MFIGQNQFCSSDLLAKIADVIDSAVLITRLGSSGHYDQRIIYLNQSFTNITGYGNDELLGRSIDVICDPRTGAAKMLDFYSNCRSGQSFSLHVDSFKKQGGEIKLKFEVRPIVDNVQGAYYYIIMCSVLGAEAARHYDNIERSQQAQQQYQQAQYQQPQYQQTAHQFQPAAPQFQPAYQPQPAFGQPAFNQPQFPQPQPQFGQPQFGQPQYGQQQYAAQGFAQARVQPNNEPQNNGPQRQEPRVEPKIEPKVESYVGANAYAGANSGFNSNVNSGARHEGYQYHADNIQPAAQTAASRFAAQQEPQPQPDGGYSKGFPGAEPEDYGIPVAPVVTGLQGKKQADIANNDKVADYCKTQFLANMSHDLRTPLNAIIGFSEVIKDQLFGPIENNRYVSYASDIHKSGQELLGTINEIMELSEVEPEAEKIEEDKVDLSDIVESVLDVLSPKAFESDVKIIKALDAEDVKFKGDRRKLKQMVAGVINNALKYSKKGSKIELSTSITDRGDYRLVVYAPTAHLASTKSSLGSLLGTVTKKMENDNPEIALARKFVEAHQGKFSVFHSASSGTEINVTLPSTRISIEPEKKTWLKVIS